MVQIYQDFIPKGRRNRPGYVMKAEYITVHDTGNTSRGANATSHANYLRGDTAANIPASWHHTVDDKQAIQHLPHNESGWHAGDGANGPGNRKSIGVEICQNADGDRAKAEENTAKLIAMIMLEEGIPLSKVVQHNYWSGKNCPNTFRSKGTWNKFLQMVQKEFINLSVLPVEESAGTGVFKDVPDNHWAKESIEKAYRKGIINGVGNDLFGLGQALTREQLCVILDRMGLLD